MPGTRDQFISCPIANETTKKHSDIDRSAEFYEIANEAGIEVIIHATD